MFRRSSLLLLLVAQVASFTINHYGRLQGYAVGSPSLQKQLWQSVVKVADTDVSDFENVPGPAELSDSSDESESLVTEEEASPTADDKKQSFKAEKFTAFVGNLPYSSEVMEIRELFSQHGEVVYVNLPRDRDSGQPRGFAFVDMASKEDLEKVVEALNGVELGDRAIRVVESVPKEDQPKKAKRNVSAGQKLYVGNLSFDTTESDIRELYSKYGTVTGIYLPKDDDGTSRGFAFVTMSKDSYESAIEATNEMEFMGRPLKVSLPLPPGKKPTASSSRTKIYVGNLSFYTASETVAELFEEFGTVHDCYLPEDRVTGSSRGFGFVTMDKDAALAAIEETDGCELDGRIIRVNEAQTRWRSQDEDDDFSEE